MGGDQREGARELRRLHLDPEVLVLVNVWDAASARTVAAQPGCRALATASASIARAHGVGDGEQLTRDEMLAAVRRIAGAVDLPVSADLEGGYGATAADVRETMTLAIDAGAVGCNIEDSTRDGAALRLAEAAERVAATRAAAGAAGVELVINARTDALAAGGTVQDALERGRAYAAAGADCVFVLGARTPEVIRAVVAGMGAPVSVLAGAGSPPIADLGALGVARVSVGPGSMGVAYAALGRVAADLLAGGTPPEDLAFRP